MSQRGCSLYLNSVHRAQHFFFMLAACALETFHYYYYEDLGLNWNRTWSCHGTLSVIWAFFSCCFSSRPKMHVRRNSREPKHCWTSECRGVCFVPSWQNVVGDWGSGGRGGRRGGGGGSWCLWIVRILRRSLLRLLVCFFGIFSSTIKKM